MPPPDPHLHPKGLSIPMTQTLTPSRHPLTLPQVIHPLQSHLQTLIWTTLSHVKPSSLMTPPLNISWMPIPPLTLSTKPTSIMCLNILPYSPSYSVNKTHIYHVSKHSGSLLLMGGGQWWPCWLRCENFGKDWKNCLCHWNWQP